MCNVYFAVKDFSCYFQGLSWIVYTKKNIYIKKKCKKKYRKQKKSKIQINNKK